MFGEAQLPADEGKAVQIISFNLSLGSMLGRDIFSSILERFCSCVVFSFMNGWYQSG